MGHRNCLCVIGVKSSDIFFAYRAEFAPGIVFVSG